MRLEPRYVLFLFLFRCTNYYSYLDYMHGERQRQVHQWYQLPTATWDRVTPVFTTSTSHVTTSPLAPPQPPQTTRKKGPATAAPAAAAVAAGARDVSHLEPQVRFFCFFFSPYLTNRCHYLQVVRATTMFTTSTTHHASKKGPNDGLYYRLGPFCKFFMYFYLLTY